MDTTQIKALKLARFLWGEQAFVLHAERYFVGVLNGPVRFFYGAGSSWDEAFKDAHLTLN